MLIGGVCMSVFCTSHSGALCCVFVNRVQCKLRVIKSGAGVIYLMNDNHKFGNECVECWALRLPPHAVPGPSPQKPHPNICDSWRRFIGFYWYWQTISPAVEERHTTKKSVINSKLIFCSRMVRAENELPTIMNLRAHCVALCIMENDTHTHRVPGKKKWHDHVLSPCNFHRHFRLCRWFMRI